MNTIKPSFRLLNVIGLIVCSGSLAFALYMQYFQGLEPCPLCMVQRYVFYVIAAIFLFAAIHNCKNIGRYIYSAILVFFSIVGLLVSSRHIYFQSLPPEEVPSCTMAFDRLLEMYPLLDVLKIAMQGSAECSKVSFSLLGLSMPQWALLEYLGFFLIGIFIIIGHKKRWI